MKKLIILPLLLLAACNSIAQKTEFQEMEFDKDVTVKGDLILEQDVDLAGNIDVDGTVSTDGLTNDGTATLNGTVNVTGSGNVALSAGTWNGNHLVLGTYHIWNNAGELRIKNGAPANATDGAAIGGGGGGGDMLAATYDPAAVAQQIVGLTATQSPTNKTFNSTNSWVSGAITLPTSLSTIAGRISWVSDEVRVGDGTSGLTLADLTSAQDIENKNFVSTNSWQGGNIEMEAVASAPALGDTHGTNWIVQKTDGAILWTGNGVSLASGVKRFSADTEGANLYNKTFDTTNTWNQGTLRLKNENTPSLPSEGNIAYNTQTDVIQYRDGAGVQTIANTSQPQTISNKILTDTSGVTIKDGFGYNFSSGSLSYFNGTAWSSTGTGLVAGSSFGNAWYSGSNGHIVNAIRGNDATDGFWVIKDTANDGTYDETLLQVNDVAFKYLGDEVATLIEAQTLSNKTLNGASFSGAVDIDTTTGIDFNPGSNVDLDVLSINDVIGLPKLSWVAANTRWSVNSDFIADYFTSRGSSGYFVGNGIDQDLNLVQLLVSGDPKLYWDESEDLFKFSHRLNVPSSLEVAGVGGIDFLPGSDMDIDLLSPIVNGGPKMFWDESENMFAFSGAGIRTLGPSMFLAATDFRTDIDVEDSSGDSHIRLSRETTGGAIRISDETGDDAIYLEVGAAGAGEILVQDSANNLVFSFDGDNGLETNRLQWDFRDASSTLGFRIETDGQPLVYHDSGIGFISGDADHNIFYSSVTGTPTFSWDESENKFSSTHGIILDGTSGQAPDYRLWDSTGDLVFRTYFGSFGSVSNWANLSANTRATVAIDSGDEGYLTLINSSNQEAIHADAGDGIQTDDLGISVRASVGSGTHRGGISSAGVAYGNNQAVTLGAAATTFAATSNFITLTGDGGGNNLATITGLPGPCLVSIVCTDSNVTFVDNNSHTANTFDLPANLPGADDQTFLFHFDGTSFYFIYGSAN